MVIKMKDKDEFRIYKNDEYDDDAQAVDESELLPIFNTMHFSGDIQPVEDFQIPEYEKIKRTKDRSDSKRADIKKKTNPIFSVLDTVKKRVIAAVSAAVAVVLIVTGIVLGVSGGAQNKSPIMSVYSVGSKLQMLLADGGVYSLPEAEDIKVSKNGMYLYFSKNTTSKTGKFDLRAVNVGKKRSLQKGGSVIDTGVDEGWQVNGDGSLMCYTKTQSGFKTLYLYSAETGKSEQLVSDIEEVFLPSTGDVVYFTRRVGSIYSLHRLRVGEEHQNVASGINYVNFCNSDEGFEVLYTVQTGKSTNVNVYIVRNYEEPREICSNVSEVYANEYKYKGNLYYFTADKSNVNWQDFIHDSYSESDANMKKPLESDYLVEKGFIFKRYVLDTAAYKSAVNKYNAKEKRDEIRNALNQIDLGLSVEDEYTCYVYNGLTTKKLASGVKLDNVMSYSFDGAPRLVYRKSVIAVEDKIQMNKLVEVSSYGGVDNAIDYVLDTIGGSYKLSDDCIYTWYDSTKVLEYNVTGYDVDKTEFVLASSSAMYVLSDGKLYLSKISQAELSNGQLVDSDVTDCTYSDGYLYFTKAITPETLSLYRHSAESGTEHICDDMYLYFAEENDFAVLLTRQQSENELMNIGVFADGKYTLIDTDAGLRSFVYSGKTLAYLKNIGASDLHNAGEMYVYTPEKGAEKLADDVTEILYIK